MSLKIGIRIFLLIAGFFVMNETYKKILWKEDKNKYGDLLDSLDKVVYTSDVLYFAESSNFSYLPGEPNQKKISEMVQDFIPGLRINSVNKGALHAGIYLSLCKKIPEDSPVKTVIITLNLRSFNADWINSKLENSLMQQNVMLQPYPPLVNRFLLAFRAYDFKTPEERNAIIQQSWKENKLNFPYPVKYTTTYQWDNALANGSFLLDDGSWDMEKIVLATSYVKTFAFQIDTNNNPRINDFDTLCEYAKTRGWHLIFNLLAENTQKAKELVGDDLVFLMRWNSDLLVNRYRNKGVTVVDNLEQVTSDDYIDKNWTTEHYLARGRLQIAHNVAKAIGEFYPTLTMNDIRNLPLFYNNFEGLANWTSPGPKTSELSFSGNFSYKIFTENPYSETYEIQFGQLFSKPPKQINLNWKTCSHQNPDGSRMVVDIQRNGNSYSWQGFSLAENWSKNVWIDNNRVVALPNDLRITDIVKIYAWNPSDIPVFIDDVVIAFDTVSNIR